MQKTFDKLYKQSNEGKTFNKLLEIITSRNNILLAYRNMKSNTGSKTSGVDKLNIKNINDTDTDVLVEKIQKMFNNYHPARVRRVEIPKSDGSGKMRPLGIPTITDRLIQQCILQVLEPICEAKFSDNSYGFRPNRSCQNALAKAMNCMQQKHMHYCVDIDIKGFFDNVNHGKLLKQMWSLGIKDKSLLCIISKILNSEIVLPTGEVIKSDKGTPQGGIISPLLSNIVLNELDWWINNQWSNKDLKEVTPKFNKYGSRDRCCEYRRMRKQTTLKEMHIVRYADDFKIFTTDYATAKKIFTAVTKWLKERLDLDISEEKSTITNLKKNYTVFLGFKLKLHQKNNKQVVKSHMSDKAKKKILVEYVKQVKQSQYSSCRNKDLWLLNSKAIGYHNYYQIATGCSKDFSSIAFIVRRTLKYRLETKKTGTATGYIKERYGSSKQLSFVGKTAIVPISYVQFVTPLDKKRTINNYTEQGRAEIHKKLASVDMTILHYLMENVPQGTNTEFYNNRISLYSGQNGKCFVTGKLLEIGNMHCHHKVPKSVKKDNSYLNLVWVTKDVHILIHAIKAETIEYYKNHIGFDKTQLSKINKLRKQLNLSCI
ncbi:group II intron reverse transcriptase/maturase [Chakrabartyella piscis]|uniref:group II intron reverse transcriptase/maturase n=1 Tax=Chakrabartyella piscis TaxID=2918914 RepID=UPI002958693E|nr:group II intron reverse transcriptase/maturase [Chakrabartyella piscis]